MVELSEAKSYLSSNLQLREEIGVTSDSDFDVRPLGKGEHNENFVFSDSATGQSFVLRVNVLPQPFHENQVAYEYAALKLLEHIGCVPKPLFLDDSENALGKGILVESFCEGEELNYDALRPGDLRCAAQLMADVHAVKVPEDCNLFKPKDPLKELFSECVDRFKVYQGTQYEDTRYTRWIEKFFAATQKAIDESPSVYDAGHIINTETLASHFIITEEVAAEAARAMGAGRFCDQPGTFVDWERPIVGEVAQDLSFFVAPSTTFWDSEYLFPRDQIDSFLEDYWRAVDGRFDRSGFDQRFKAWLCVSVLRSQTWFCKNAARYADLGKSHKTERTIKKWDTYISDEFNEMLLRECF